MLNIAIELKINIMKTFKDLKFEPHKLKRGGVQARITFPNGHWISVIGGDKDGMFYGNGKTSFEVMSSISENKKDRSVKGWQTPKQISDHMRYIQKLK